MAAEAFVSALRDEYINSVPNALGKYFDEYGDNPKYEKMEDEVRAAQNPTEVIDRIAGELGVGAADEVPANVPPAGVAPADVAPADGNCGSAVASAEAFVRALRAEFVNGVPQALGKYFDEYGGNSDYERMEDEVRASENPTEAIDRIAATLGIGTIEKKKSWGGTDRGDEYDCKTKVTFAEWCAANGCLSTLVRTGNIGAVEDIMERYGCDKEKDKEFMKYEYSLFKGKYESEDQKVEIEDVDSRDGVHEGAIQDRQRAIARVLEFRPMLLGSSFLWVFIALAFLLNFATAQCDSKTPIGEILIPIFTVLPGSVWLVYGINRLLNLQSKTSFEGVPMVRLICSGGCFSSPRMGTVLSLTDLYGKVTRAMFIGKILGCSGKDMHGAKLNTRFNGWAESEEPSSASSQEGSLDAVALIFFVVPFGIQMCRMLRSQLKIFGAISGKKDEENVGGALFIRDCLDDHGAVADWALLKPPALIFFYAATPLVLEDEHDYARIWDLFKTKALVTTANLVPDSIVQLWLMTIYYSLSAPYTSFYPRLQLALSLASTSFLSLVAGVGLIKENFRLTVILGCIICITSLWPVVWILGSFSCDRRDFFSLGFQCVQA